mmetsp:Transcript_21648/g.49251  ORF Transcript_21648/g.49251 Transcript_21648/m.49251 type:complete len:389 (-) Transcript_21648:1023-2189(-)
MSFPSYSSTFRPPFRGLVPPHPPPQLPAPSQPTLSAGFISTTKPPSNAFAQPRGLVTVTSSKQATTTATMTATALAPPPAAFLSPEANSFFSQAGASFGATATTNKKVDTNSTTTIVSTPTPTSASAIRSDFSASTIASRPVPTNTRPKIVPSVFPSLTNPPDSNSAGTTAQDRYNRSCFVFWQETHHPSKALVTEDARSPLGTNGIRKVRKRYPPSRTFWLPAVTVDPNNLGRRDDDLSPGAVIYADTLRNVFKKSTEQFEYYRKRQAPKTFVENFGKTAASEDDPVVLLRFRGVPFATSQFAYAVVRNYIIDGFGILKPSPLEKKFIVSYETGRERGYHKPRDEWREFYKITAKSYDHDQSATSKPCKRKRWMGSSSLMQSAASQM